MSKIFTTLMLNWYANPYHAPILVGQVLGYYKDVGLDLSILQPTDPSDVTKIVGNNNVDIGLKAMIHTIAGRTKGYPITSIGTLLDEPPTGLISLKSSGINNFDDIRGKRLGYIGEFGKQIIDNLAKHAKIEPSAYETVRVGMYMVDAISAGRIDAGIGFSNFHQVELESETGPTSIIRIDQLAGLGCCCFCSIQIIAHEQTLKSKPEVLQAFLAATERGASYVTQHPEEAFDMMCEGHPRLKSETQHKIFMYTLPFFSRTLLNVERDWNKVYQYTQHLGLHQGELDLAKCYTNDYIAKMPYSPIKSVMCCA
ncbi:MAG: ABC transporter substrate-binding protein [Gammaproteobacteria bacterium]|jgi:ABC-type nitrate/sulfonate/bicarbonate transport system substrate-binding protein|nr:ABC transporter substrate-binding protein [Gammaproteobacteria bacterium]